MRESFGSDGQPGSYSDVDYTDCLFLVGHNMAHTQTVLWSRVLDRLEGHDPPTLLVVDPRKSDTAKKATIHLAPKIGTNVALLNGIQHLLLKNDSINHDFVSKHVVGLDGLRNVVKDYTPKFVQEVTGVPIAELEQTAEVLANTPTLLSTALQGVYQSNQATAAACQLNNINLLLGHIGRRGSGILQMNGQPTAQNNRETGCDGEYPGFRNFQNPNHMKEIADIWNIDYVKMPHWNQPTHIENMLTYIADGSIKFFWISGTNPLVSLPNLPRVRQLLTKPDLFVVTQDIFLTETAAISDVVLPAAQWGEKTGVFTNADRTMHLSQQAVEPPGEARADLDIWLDFARRMDFRTKDGKPLIPWKTSEEVFEAWKEMSRGRPLDCSALTYAKLKGGSGIQWPCTDAHPYGKERLFEDGVFFTDTEYCEDYGHDLETGTPISKSAYNALNPAGRAILKAAHYKASLEQPNEEYPFLLSTGRNVYHFHTRTKTGRSRRLQQAYPEPTVLVSENDARDLQLSDGEMVVVRSRRGCVELPVSIGGINDGEVFIPFHFGYFDTNDRRARAANELTMGEWSVFCSTACKRRRLLTPCPAQWDPVSKQPQFKSGAVRIEKCVQREEGEQPHAQEEQGLAVASVAKNKPDAHLTASNEQEKGIQRVRRLELWMGAAIQGLDLLLSIYQDLIPRLVHDPEVHAGLRVMQRLTRDILNEFRPIIARFPESQNYGRDDVHRLRDAIFPFARHGAAEASSDPYLALSALQSLDLYLTYIEGHFTALKPASQALWDADFQEAVDFGTTAVARQKAWASQHIKVKSPQTLLVTMIAKE